jgi:hypothetical protein
MNKIFFLNFGHASTPHFANAEVIRKDITVQLQDPSDPAEITTVALDLAASIAADLANYRKEGYLVVIGLPGASAVAVAIAMALQGLLGFTPLSVVGTKRNGGFIYDLTRAFDPGDIRDKARFLRGQFGL